MADDDVDRLFETLADDRRTFALHRLRDHASLALADLADETAVWWEGARIDELSGEIVRDVYFQLYYCHVPELESADLVEYDQDRDLVYITERGERVAAELASDGVDAFA